MLAASLFAYTAFFQSAHAAGILWSVDWSADGKLYVVGGENTWLFDANTHERHSVPSFESIKSARKVRWHPSGKLLAVSSRDVDATAIHDISSGKKILLKTVEGTRGIAWSPDGDRLATAGNDGSLQIWDSTGELLHTSRQEKARSLTGVAWHPADDKILSVGDYITLYDASGTILKQMRHRPEAKAPCLLLCVEWHPSGEFFVVGDYGNHDTGELPVIQFWSADFKLLETITAADPAPFRNISWNRSGSFLASAGGGLGIWSRRGELQYVGKSPDHLWGVRWSPDGNQVVTSSIEGRVTLWSASADVLRKVLTVD